jgi:hypothetical protein
VALEEIMEDTNKPLLIIDKEGGVHSIHFIGEYETEVNGEKGMHKFAFMTDFQFKDGFKIAPGTVITDELQNEMAANWTGGDVDFVRLDKNKDGETIFERYDGPDAGDIIWDYFDKITPKEHEDSGGKS